MDRKFDLFIYIYTLNQLKPQANDPAPAATVTMSAAASADASSSSAAPAASTEEGAAGGADATDTYHKGEEALNSLKGSSPKPILVMFMSKTCGCVAYHMCTYLPENPT